ncbi:hypothetical protein D3C75_569660 [compost metagenome]
MKQNGCLASPDPGCIHLAEHLLKPNCEHRGSGVAVIHRNPRTAGNSNMCRRFPLQKLPAVPIQQSFQRSGHRHPLQIAQIAHTLNKGLQPFLKGSEQGLFRHIRKIRLQAMQEFHTLAELHRSFVPRQQSQPFLSDYAKQHLFRLFRSGPFMRSLLQDQSTQQGPPAGLDTSALFVPVDFAFFQQVVSMMLQQVCLRQVCGKHNPALAGAVINAGRHYIGRTRQRLPFLHGRPPATREQKRAIAALLPDPVGVGEGQQQPGEADVVRQHPRRGLQLRQEAPALALHRAQSRRVRSAAVSSGALVPQQRLHAQREVAVQGRGTP